MIAVLADDNGNTFGGLVVLGLVIGVGVVMPAIAGTLRALRHRWRSRRAALPRAIARRRTV